MSNLELPPLPQQWGRREDFALFIDNLHQAIVPGCTPGFVGVPMRYSDGTGDYYYFPHPQDGGEVLDLALTLAQDADDKQRSLILPAGVLAAHLLLDDNGKVSRGFHAMLAGKTAAEIEGLRICRPHAWTITDTAARAIVDLSPPEALVPYINSNVYEVAGVGRRLNLKSGYEVSNDSVLAYQGLRRNLPEEYQIALDSVIALSTAILFEGNKYLMSLFDADSVEFALSAQTPEDQAMPEASINLSDAMAALGEDGLKRFVGDLWRYRLLRAKAAVACVGNTALGSQIVSLPDHGQPMSISDHYARLTNNLVKG